MLVNNMGKSPSGWNEFFPFGCAWESLDAGACGALTTLGGRDFLLSGPRTARANFAFALGQFQRMLVAVAKIPLAMVGDYTLHSLKTTGLSWALQIGLEPTARQLWGHHRAAHSGTAMLAKYSRNDVLLALRAQFQAHIMQSETRLP